MKMRAVALGALLGLPPVVWAAQGLVGWYLSSRGCEGLRPTLGVVRATMLVISVVALGSTLVGVVRGIGFIRGAHPAPSADVDRRQFFGMVALVVGVTLSLGVLLATLPMVLLTRCGGAS